MIFFELVPNRSLTLRSAAVFYLSIVVVTFAIAILFAMAGFWPILTVAGIEMAALGAALWWTMRKTKLANSSAWMSATCWFANADQTVTKNTSSRATGRK